MTRALCDSIDPDADHGYRLCQLLGLDPDETTSISVVIEAGKSAVITWAGRRHVPLHRIATALADVFDDPDPAPTGGDPDKWEVGPDPWGKAPNPPC